MNILNMDFSFYPLRQQLTIIYVSIHQLYGNAVVLTWICEINGPGLVKTYIKQLKNIDRLRKMFLNEEGLKS